MPRPITPFHFAACRGSHKAILYLVNNHGFKDILNQTEMRDLIHHCITGTFAESEETPMKTSPLFSNSVHAALIIILIKLGADVFAQKSDSLAIGCVIHISAKHLTPFGCHKIVHTRYFIQMGCDVNALDSENETPLHKVLQLSKKNIQNIVSTLVQNNANLGILGKRGETPLDIAIRRYLLGNVEEKTVGLLRSRISLQEFVPFTKSNLCLRNTQSQPNLLQTLFPPTITNLDKYVIYSHSLTKLEPSNPWKPTVCLLQHELTNVRSMILNQYKDEHLWTTVTVPKHLQTVDIIVILCTSLFEKRKKSYIPYTLESFRYFSMLPQTIILILDDCNPSEHQPLEKKLIKNKFFDVIYIPATKILIELPPDNDPFQSHFNAQILCANNGYCDSKSSFGSLKDLQPTMRKPLQLHKKYFKITRGIKVLMYMSLKYYYSNEKLSNGIKHCANGKYSHWLGCDGDTMTQLEIVRVHNFTVGRARSSSAYYNSRHDQQQYITAREYYYFYSYIKVFKRAGLHYYKFLTHTMIYCQPLHGNDDAKTAKPFWTETVINRLWKLVMLTLIGTTLVLSENGTATSTADRIAILFLNLILAILSQQNCFRRNKMYRIAFLSGILFGMSYKANLTVTKLQTLWKENDKEIEKIQNLTDLVERGYAFASDTTQMFDLHPEDFEKAGLKNLTSFEWSKLSASSEKDYIKFKKRIIEGEKLSIPIVTEVSQVEIQNMANESLGNNLECKGLPQEVGKNLHNWEMYTVNRYWVIETIHWLQVSGLLQYWDVYAGKGNKTRGEEVLLNRGFAFEVNLFKIIKGIVGVMCVITVTVFLTEMMFWVFQLITEAFGKQKKRRGLKNSETQVADDSSDRIENP
ncbi:unnamed protein product [Orchesella dallaii]|uniref:Uncharacterized protein n=1 Tax=Orchesella dallaii TaxID=48710 RepID=A0ABP1RPC0_9HEXA